MFLPSFPLTLCSPPYHREENTVLHSGLGLKHIPTTEEFRVNEIYLNQ